MSVEALRDLNAKLQLESKLARRVSQINASIVDSTIREFFESDRAFDAAVLEQKLAEELDEHYLATATAFGTQLTDVMPADIAVQEEERSYIAESLAAYFIARSLEQAAIITATNQENVNAGVQVARESVDADGAPLPKRDKARIAGAVTARHLRGRLTTIATTETQHAAEASKATEADVLSGRTPAIVAPAPADAGVTKEWVTVGDENVRDAHVAADSQTVDMAKPYTVGGELLRYPGDTSLGASAGNVMNCRCSSVYDAKEVFAVRRRQGMGPTVEREPSEQLLESIGL